MSTEFSDTQKPLFTDQEALDFHQVGKPGKIEIAPTKPETWLRLSPMAPPF